MFRRSPLWLFLDPAAWLALALSAWRLVSLVREMLARPDDGRGILPRADLNRLAEALAETEADIDWAIARQVQRLCGLPADGVVRMVPAPARTMQTFRARYRAQVRRLGDCTAIAARRAARARRRAARPAPVAFPADAALVAGPFAIPAPLCARIAAAQPRAPPALRLIANHTLQIG
jgi:hypothetical protein